MITTSQFTKEAKEYVKIIEKRIILIDGDKLTQLMIDFGVGVSEIQTYILQKVDSDYFDEDIWYTLSSDCLDLGWSLIEIFVISCSAIIPIESTSSIVKYL